MKKFVWHIFDSLMPRVKQCPCGPSPAPTPLPPPPHNSDSEPDYSNPNESALLASIPTSTITLNSPPAKKQRAAAAAATVAISDKLEQEKEKDPTKHRRYNLGSSSASSSSLKPPFIKGQVGKIIITDKPVCSLAEMLDRSSLIVSSWRKALSTEEQGNYVLTDPFGKLWYAPHVFHLWREAVQGGVMEDISLDETRLSIICEGLHFSLCTSKRKQSFCDVLHPIGSNNDKL